MRAGGRHSLEFSVVTVAVGVLALFLLRALATTAEAVEEAAVQREIAALRVDLIERVAHREAVGGGLPASRNPLRWIGRAPPDYVGEVDRAPDAAGVWYYDRSRDELAYRFRSGRESRFRLVRGGDAAGTAGALAGVALREVGATP